MNLVRSGPFREIVDPKEKRWVKDECLQKCNSSFECVVEAGNLGIHPASPWFNWFILLTNVFIL